MIRKQLTIALLGSVLLMSGCFGESAEQMMETARFEELQHNTTHARELYERVIQNFPGTDEAKQASERLAALRTEP